MCKQPKDGQNTQHLHSYMFSIQKKQILQAEVIGRQKFGQQLIVLQYLVEIVDSKVRKCNNFEELNGRQATKLSIDGGIHRIAIQPLITNLCHQLPWYLILVFSLPSSLLRVSSPFDLLYWGLTL